jgi:glycosyltransferase involved in cell wall biosynthesis
MITYNDRGLSKSRNKALDNMRGEICLLSDDDVIYLDDIEDLILQEFDAHPDCDVLAFQVEGIDRKFKDYPARESAIGYLGSLKVSSVEIAFRADKIKKAGVRFHELFGTGSKYCSGEENIFLFECLHRGLKMKYIPRKIANLYVGESSWFKGFNRDYFFAKGAAYTAMSEKLSSLLILQFLIRKHSIYHKELKLTDAARAMYAGKAEYLEWKVRQ